ncbi:MAG: shikimate dehydrogenase [Actinomycetota bacterium]|jgi:shikimate dehydrogenase|nr:shikimate dehydrogenase [Actinomycetota bacterium]
MTGATRVVGIIGWPVSHSLSPVIHGAAFDALDMDWVYVPLPVPPGSVPAAVAGLPALGLAGANVTMPHKTEIAGILAADLTEDAARLQAVNTIEIRGEQVLGHNTDAPGFDRFLRRDAGLDPRGVRALIYGAGGAARACALALAQGGAATLEVAVRDASRAAALRRAVEGLDTVVTVIAFEDAVGWKGDLVIDATPIGSDGQGVPPEPAYAPGMLVVDLKYHPSVTPLQRNARAAGSTAFGGLGLLLHQAGLSFELWSGRPAPLEVMSAAAIGAIAEPAP